MTPREYLDLFRERWRAVIGGLLLGILAAVAVVQLSLREPGRRRRHEHPHGTPEGPAR
jgi:hypothetical protein